MNEMKVAVVAGRAAEDVSTRELEQLGDAWNSYDSLSRRSYLNIGTMALERSLIQRTSTLADRVIADFRAPFPTVREKQWQMARDSLARAIAVGGYDRGLRAALRYCEGHLHRINGEAGMRRGETVAGAAPSDERRCGIPRGRGAPSRLARSFPWTGSHVRVRPRGSRPRRRRPQRGAASRIHTNRSRNGSARRRISRAWQQPCPQRAATFWTAAGDRLPDESCRGLSRSADALFEGDQLR